MKIPTNRDFSLRITSLVHSFLLKCKTKSYYCPSVSEFAEAVLLKNATRLADIPSKKSSLHYVRVKKLVVVIVDENLINSCEITKLLLNLCQPEHAITLTIQPKVDFKSENILAFKDEITCLRSIEGKLNNVESLEAPNFIASVAAGVCSFRSNNGLKTQSYVPYTDNVALRSCCCETFA